MLKNAENGGGEFLICWDPENVLEQATNYALRVRVDVQMDVSVCILTAIGSQSAVQTKRSVCSPHSMGIVGSSGWLYPSKIRSVPGPTTGQTFQFSNQIKSVEPIAARQPNKYGTEDLGINFCNNCIMFCTAKTSSQSNIYRLISVFCLFLIHHRFSE